MSEKKIDKDLLDFGGYLVDNHEGTIITEETVVQLLDDFIQSEYREIRADVSHELEAVKKERDESVYAARKIKNSLSLAEKTLIRIDSLFSDNDRPSQIVSEYFEKVNR